MVRKNSRSLQFKKPFAAFLISYYGTESVSGAGEPAPTITTKDCLALVTLMVEGTPFVIIDICLQMLNPSERCKARGFPAGYVITHGAESKPLTKTQQVTSAAKALPRRAWKLSLERKIRGGHQLDTKSNYDQSLLATARQATRAPGKHCSGSNADEVSGLTAF
ncbi:hypothetical protein IV03_07765 [Pseudomonas congelans]|nr:hypothetical protein IV03_07765 [Pseudomonas congelans]